MFADFAPNESGTYSICVDLLYFSCCALFTALHCMQSGLFTRKLCVRPSVCLSNASFVTKQKKDLSRFLYLVLWEEEWLVGATSSTWNFWSNWPRWNENADFQPIFARSASAVTPSEKSSINTNRKSTTRFPVSLRWTSYFAPKPKGAQKRKTAVFHIKCTSLEESLLQSFCCENCQRQSCKAFIDLSIRAKMIGRGRFLLRENLADGDPPLQNADFQSIFARIASAVTPSKKVQSAPLVYYALSNEPKINIVRCL